MSPLIFMNFQQFHVSLTDSHHTPNVMYTNLIVEHKEGRGISNPALAIGTSASRVFPAWMWLVAGMRRFSKAALHMANGRIKTKTISLF